MWGAANFWGFIFVEVIYKAICQFVFSARQTTLARQNAFGWVLWSFLHLI